MPDSSSFGWIEARNPTRPKLTPITGMSLPRKRCSPRNIVPSPPSTTAMSAPLRSWSGSPTPCFSTSSSGNNSSTPASRATFSSRSSAGPIVGGLPWVITAARRTALLDRGGDPAVDVVGELRALPGVRTLEHDDARIGAEALVQLAVADVDRDHARGAALQQDVREAPGGRADVEAVAAARVDAERIEGVRQFRPATRDVRWRALHFQLRALIDLRPRFVVAGHATCEDERLRLRTALGESALDEQHVEPLLHAAADRPSTSRSLSAMRSNGFSCSELCRSIASCGSSGIRPSNETPSDHIDRAAATTPKTSMRSPQCGQT